MKLSLERLARQLRDWVAGLVDPLSLVSGPIGVGGVTAGQVLRFDTATGTLLPARADAVATARGLAGVALSSGAVGAAVDARASGVRRVLADASCVPVRGGEAYLSRVTAGAVTSVLDGSTYPCLVGYFDESAVAVDGTVAVRLLIDQARDDAREWTLSDEVLTVAASSVSFSVNRALFRAFTLDAFKVGTASDQSGQPVNTGTQTWYSSAATVVCQATNVAAANVMLLSAGVLGGNIFMSERLSDGVDWVGKWETVNEGYSGASKYRSVGTYRSQAAPPAVGAAWNGAVYRIGSRVVIRARLRVA